MNCSICNKKLTGRQTRFCSRKCKSQETNNVNQNYESQQKRGWDRKIKLVDMLGGKCKCCGYKKNYSALTFHHLEPSKKERTLDIRQLSNTRWELLVEEVKKCDLLCFNCHMELHHPQHNLKLVVPASGASGNKPL
jgi:hypothetical protein